MKIAWLHSHFLYSIGATRHVYELSKRLRAKHEITIYVEKSSTHWKAKFAEANIEVKEISPLTSTSIIYWLFFPLFAIKEALFLKKESKKFDVVIVNIFPMNWFSLFFDKPVIFLCLEPFSFFHNKELINKLAPVKRYLVKLLAFIYEPLDLQGTRGVQLLLAHNSQRAAAIQKVYGRVPDAFSSIGVDSHFFKQTQSVDLIKKYKGNKIILHSTDFTIPKGTHFLIKALPKIVKQVPSVKVLIISAIFDIAEKRKLESLALKMGVGDHIEFLGSVDEKLLPAYYTLADVSAFVADPSNTVSGASLIVLESLACKTPVICTTGCPEGMVKDKTGYLVDPRITNELARKISYLLNHPKIATEMGNYGRRFVLDNYSWEKEADKFDGLLAIALNGSTTNKKQSKNILKLIYIFCVTFTAGVLLVSFTSFPNLLAAFFDTKSDVKKTETIVVLSGGSYQNKMLSLFSYDRLFYGITLYKKGLAPKLIMVGRSSKDGESDAEVMKRLAVDLGVPKESIITGNNSYDTYENIKEMKEIMNENNLQSALLVTSSIHIKRSMLVAKKMGAHVFAAPVNSTDQFRIDPADRLILFYSELREIAAFSIYKIRGQI